jgi:hypothetical protein
MLNTMQEESNNEVGAIEASDARMHDAANTF